MEQEVQLTEAKRQKPARVKSKTRKKIKKRWFVLGGLVIIIAVAVAMCTSAARNIISSLLSFEETSLIEQMELTYSISATGTVVSAEAKNVFSTLSYTIEEVYVKVGDVVREGDPLCRLDTKALTDQIEKKELSVGMSAEAAAQQVKTARDAYSAARSALNDGLNSSLISAESQVTTAFNNWEKAQKTYNDYITTLNMGENSQILQLESSVTSARNSINSARDAADAAKQEMDSAKASLTKPTGDVAAAEAAIAAAQAEANTKQYALEMAHGAYELARDASLNADPPDVALEAAAEGAFTAYKAAEAAYTKAQSDVTKAQQALTALTTADAQYAQNKAAYDAKVAAYESRLTALNTAESSYDSALKQLNAAYRNADTTAADYAKNVDTAYESYQTALASLAAAEKSADTQLQSSQNSLASTQISANNDLSLLELAQMQEELDKTNITATKSGTVTAVYAKAGNSGSGLLFVIEDTDNLKVETTVKEYDMGVVRVGQRVVIKSDATGDDEIEGEIENISPASKKTATGAIDVSSDVVFPTDVVVKAKGTGLRIGMSTRLNYIIEQKQDVLAVPYEAVYTNEVGETCVLILKDQNDGTHLIESLPVTTGMETDLYIEVGGAGVTEGLRVINTADSFIALVGQKIPVAEKRAASAGNMPFMMAGRVGG